MNEKKTLVCVTVMVGLIFYLYPHKYFLLLYHLNSKYDYQYRLRNKIMVRVIL